MPYCKRRCWTAPAEGLKSGGLHPAARLLVLPIIVVTMTSCSPRLATSSVSTPGPDTAPSPAPTELLALTIGELALEDDCLRVLEDFDPKPSYLLAWPPHFTVITEDESVRVQKANREEVVLTIGEKVRVGGGIVPLHLLTDPVIERLPANCPGPYWLVSEIAPLESTQAPN